MKQILFSLFVLFSITAIAQNNNPFESIGKESAMLTLSNGRYEEVFKSDKFRRVGSVMMNTETMKIDHFLTEEELKECQDLETEKQASRFLSIDPLTRSFPFYTPYQFAGNKPIVAIDLDGLEDVWIHFIKQEDGTIIQNGDAKRNLSAAENILASQTWGVNIPKTGVVYTLTSQQTRQTQIVYTGVTATVIAEGTPRQEPKIDVGHVGVESAMRGNTMYEMEGEEGLKDYSKGCDRFGSWLLVTPLAPVGGLLTKWSDVIDTGLDFKNESTGKAVTNLAIRTATWGSDYIIGKQIENLNNTLPRNLGEKTYGERGADYLIDRGTEHIEDKLTESDTPK